MITAVLSGQTQSQVAAQYGVSKGWVSKLMTRYHTHGETALQPQSRRPKTSPTATTPATVELIIRLRKQLTEQGLDAGPDTIRWHLAHHHNITVSRATVARHLTSNGLVTPQPKKRPKSSYLRFEASLPNECWQSDFTHYRLTNPNGHPGTDTEIITWLDDCNITQKNGRAAHPQTQGKIERFQQILKKWLTAQPHQPATLPQLQTLLDQFTTYYNHHRPHRSLPHQATPATLYTNRPKAAPTTDRSHDTHHRVRHDTVDTNGKLTLRIAGRLHHIGIGRTHARTPVIMLIHDLHVRIVAAATGEHIRELTIDPTRDYQPTGRPPGPQPKTQKPLNPQPRVQGFPMS